MTIEKELIQTLSDYIEMLGEEIRELASIASLHGWQSTRIKKGAQFRTKIVDLKSKLL